MRIIEAKMAAPSKEKEWFYVGVAHDPMSQERIIKYGTTKDLNRRLGEHRRKNDYKQYPLHDMVYCGNIRVSHENTLLLEEGLRRVLRELENSDEVFIRNDRYVLKHNESVMIRVTVRKKVYEFFIPGLDNLPEV